MVKELIYKEATEEGILMKSRERVIKALNHEEPDRIPKDFGMATGTGIHGIAHRKLMNYLGFHGPTKLWNPTLVWSDVDQSILEKFEIDFMRITKPVNNWIAEVYPDKEEYLVPEDFQTEELKDGSRVLMYKNFAAYKREANGYWYEPEYRPLKDATLKDLKDFSWDPPYGYFLCPDKNEAKNSFKGIRELAKHWYENSELALVGWFGGSIFEPAQALRGLEQFFIDTIKNQGFIEGLLDKLVDVNKEYAKYYLEAVGDYVQVIIVGGEDLGSQGRMQINPETYRKLVKPRHKELWQFIKKNTNAKLLVHSCGYIEPIIGDLIEAGIDIINPVQISAGMNAKSIKEKFGKEVSFWGGGCSVQKTLPFGTTDDVEKEVKERVRVLAPGGGFVFCAEQSIQMDIPPENIVALYDAAKKYGNYPVSY